MGNYQPIQVLLVEDSPSDAKLMQHWLGSSQLVQHVHLVTDGEQALRFLRSENPFVDAPKPDLVLLDLNLPKLGGFEVLAEIKQDDQIKHIPVIVLTASAIAEDVHRAQQLAASRYLAKPSDADGFDDLIQELEAFWSDRDGSPAA